ncbi:MAG: FHA domain-containing protein [Deltaproteobacteria bacterium]|nr:FHA domain-containing protein [Deltaproteobacteria bacterium]
MWYLIIYDSAGNEIGRAPLIDGQVVYTGSGPENTLVIPDASVPPQAAWFYLNEGYPVIEDDGSGFVVMDGYPLAQSAYVSNENQLFVGSYNLYIYFDESVQTSPVPVPAFDDPPPPPPPPDVAYDQSYPPPQEAYAQGDGYSKGSGEVVVNQPDPSFGGDAIQIGSDAIQLTVNKHLKLVAREGYLDGREFVLAYDGFFDIGRAPDVEIVIDDPSVSRVHARLKLEEGGTLLVQDLRSMNGTFINGVDCKRDIASIGDRIRIGEVPLLLTSSSFGSEPGKKISFDIKSLVKSKVAILVITGLFFLLAGVMVLKLAKKNRPKKTKIELKKDDFQESLKVQVARLKAEAKDLMRVDKWDKAISKLKNALTLMPDDKIIKESLSYAYFERGNYKIFQNALNTKNRMNHEDRVKALRLFHQIDPKSQYYRTEMAPIIMDLKKELARHYRDDGLAQYKARYYDKAHDSLCKYFDLDSQLDDIRMEEKIRLDLKRVELLSKYKKSFVACTAKRFKEARIPLADRWAKQAKKEISDKYPKGIDEIIIVYFTGNPKDAILRLKELTKSYRGRRKYGKYSTMITELVGQLQSIVQSYEAGETKLQQDDPEGAKKEWTSVLTMDRLIIPGKLKSSYRRNISNRLAGVYYKEGKKSLDLLRYEEAFELFKKGLDMDPDDTTELRDQGIKKLEQRATEFLSEAQGLAQSGSTAEAAKLATRIVKMTLSTSPTYKNAQKIISGK